MSRFTGFQNDRGVAVLDTVTGELVFYPLEGGQPTVLRGPIATPSDPVEARLMLSLPGAGGERQPTERPPPQTGFRAARRLDDPRPMVLSYPSADEVAEIKAARLARSLDSADGRGGSARKDED